MPKPRKKAHTVSSENKKKKKLGRPKMEVNTRTVHVPLKFAGHEPRLEFHQPPRKGVKSVIPMEDEASKHQYPPPGNNPAFRAKWMLFIENVISRDNFHIGHLETLKVFCKLLVEYDELEDFIAENGRSYCSVGRSGEVWKLYPEVLHLKRVEASIKEYSKLMDLVLKKDHGTESGGEQDEWK